MTKFVSFSVLYLSLFIIEIISGFLMLLVDSSNYQGNFDAVILWNFWRILFYGLPFVLFFFLLFKYLRSSKIYAPLLFSFFNLIIYVLLSCLSEIIWGKNVPLPPTGIMFWTTCVSIFLSPIILYQIPYFKRPMQSL
jgi:hypothetical protein